MKFDIGFISAETHTPEYLMHKYWARKPHNVINECIKNLTPDNGILIDPFCGSGVTLRESSLLGREAFGFDMNPAAFLISSVLINPPKQSDFNNVFIDIFNEIESKFGHLYSTSDNKTIKYVSHKIITKCECGKVVKQSEANKIGKKYTCPICGNTLRFNLESMVGTEVFNITVDKDKKYIPDSKELFRQEELSNFTNENTKYDEFDYSFPENRRILAFNGIKTSSFFTKRNFTILCEFATKIWKIEDEKIKNCSLLLLNASVAQCSRLIAHRNNLSTGGPAWSVPGFWIPQEHLETNPFVHIKARLAKINKALEYIESHPAKKPAHVMLGDSLKLLKENDIKADLIFLDPPYGDSVPYTEFSNIWNSFLKIIPSSDDDISVSDRIDKNLSWFNYSKKLNEFMKIFKTRLNKNGKLLITFNNNDMKAWEALISSLQDNMFVCQSVFYQIPAVISSKAQMSIDSSYISDVYSVYELNEEKKPLEDLALLKERLIYIANARKHLVPKIILDREFIIEWLKQNIDHHLLGRKDEIIAELFDYDKKEKNYILKEKYYQDTELLSHAVLNHLKEVLKFGSINLLDAYRKINKMCDRFGTIELSEFKDIVKDYIIDDGTKLGYKQPSLFDLIDE